jgi:hypothetical protein
MSQEARTGARKYRYVFTAEEDQLLERAVGRFGTADWDSVAGQVPGRSARQCRERWRMYVSPEVNRTPWTPDEDALLFDVLQTHGQKWGAMVGFFNNRSQNNIKNRWNTVVRKARSLGLEPADRKSFLEAGHKISSRLTRTQFECTKEMPPPDAQEFYSLGNLLNSRCQ